VPRAAIDDDGGILLDDLIGFAAQRADGTPCGQVVAIDLGPQDRLIIHDAEGEMLVPLVDELVTIDEAARRVTLHVLADWPRVPMAKAYRVPKRS
jgi:ribosomal 30S subunit maturation factor RimM